MSDHSPNQTIARLILSFYLPSLLLSFSGGMLEPVLPVFAKSLDASYGLVGLASAGVGIGMLLGDLPSAVLIRRLGHKGAMLVGVGCTALATLAVSWAQSIPEVVLYRLL